MKKTVLALTILLAAAAIMALSSVPAMAITGQCSNCHTMHNSQDGSAVVQTYAVGTPGSEGPPVVDPTPGALNTKVATPQQYLLNADCIACHTGNTATAKNSFDAPIVLHTTNPTGQGYQKTLAGGDFSWVASATGDDSTGHNVVGISLEDAAIGKTPPGWDYNATPGQNSDGRITGGNNTTWTSQLTCAGTFGCHGAHNEDSPFSAIKKSHHSNTGLSKTQANGASTVGASFRFLSGINGLEDENWEWDATESVHNEYYGVNGNSTYTTKTTISYLCAQCHGIYHSAIDDDVPSGGGSPWLRHPTDVDLPNDTYGEYNYYNPDNANKYSVEAPIARPTVPATPSSTVAPGTDIVMCLSCHRAHGSDQPDLLRWAYSGMKAGTGNDDTGCFTCHTAKNADSTIPTPP